MPPFTTQAAVIKCYSTRYASWIAQVTTFDSESTPVKGSHSTPAPTGTCVQRSLPSPGGHILMAVLRVATPGRSGTPVTLLLTELHAPPPPQYAGYGARFVAPSGVRTYE